MRTLSLHAPREANKIMTAYHLTRPSGPDLIGVCAIRCPPWSHSRLNKTDKEALSFSQGTKWQHALKSQPVVVQSNSYSLSVSPCCFGFVLFNFFSFFLLCFLCCTSSVVLVESIRKHWWQRNRRTNTQRKSRIAEHFSPYKQSNEYNIKYRHSLRRWRQSNVNVDDDGGGNVG